MNADQYIDEIVALAREAYPGYERCLDLVSFDHEEPRGKWRLVIYVKSEGSVVVCLWEQYLADLHDRLHRIIAEKAHEG